MSHPPILINEFGLHAHPFAPTADPAYCYAAPSQAECLRLVWDSIDARHGVVVVFGDNGAGKTTLLRKIVAAMYAEPQRYLTAVVGAPVPTWSSFELLRHIVEQFGLEPAEETFLACIETLNRHLVENREQVCTLLIDDAHYLNKRGQMELLRLLQNLETQQHKLLNIVLFAQTEWTTVLEAVQEFSQRINLAYTLVPLPRAELRPLIAFRLDTAGGGGPRFEETALRAIDAYTEGNLRLTVTLCRHAVALAARETSAVVTGDMILRIVETATLPNLDKRARVAAALAEAGSAIPGEDTLGAGQAEVDGNLPDPDEGLRGREQKAAELLLRAHLRQAGGGE